MVMTLMTTCDSDGDDHDSAHEDDGDKVVGFVFGIGTITSPTTAGSLYGQS